MAESDEIDEMSTSYKIIGIKLRWLQDLPPNKMFFNLICYAYLNFDFYDLIFSNLGRATTWFKVKNATPRQPSVSALTRGSIRISKDVFCNPEHSLDNLDQFSHVWYTTITLWL